MDVQILRLKPGEDVMEVLEVWLAEHKIQAASILSSVGSLQAAAIRYANQEAITHLEGKFEIISLSGTLSIHGSHVHISISDGQGHMLGGHLYAHGNRVYTTAELVLGVYPQYNFQREVCTESGYLELVVYPTEPV